MNELPRSIIERVEKPNTIISDPFQIEQQSDIPKREIQTNFHPQQQIIFNSSTSQTFPQLNTSIQNVPIGQMFRQDVYTLDLPENILVPRVILDLGQEIRGGQNIAEEHGIHFRILGSNYGMFSIDEALGRVSLVRSPDREQREKYIVRVKVSFVLS